MGMSCGLSSRLACPQSWEREIAPRFVRSLTVAALSWPTTVPRQDRHHNATASNTYRIEVRSSLYEKTK